MYHTEESNFNLPGWLRQTSTLPYTASLSGSTSMCRSSSGFTDVVLMLLEVSYVLCVFSLVLPYLVELELPVLTKVILITIVRHLRS